MKRVILSLVGLFISGSVFAEKLETIVRLDEPIVGGDRFLASEHFIVQVPPDLDELKIIDRNQKKIRKIKLPQVILSEGTIRGDILYIPNEKGQLLRVNLNTGDSVVLIPDGMEFRYPFSEHSGIIYAPRGGNLEAIDAKTGRRVWQTNDSEIERKIGKRRMIFFHGSPIIEDPFIYAVVSGTVVKMDLQTGKILACAAWKPSDEKTQYVSSKIVTGNDVVGVVINSKFYEKNRGRNFFRIFKKSDLSVVRDINLPSGLLVNAVALPGNRVLAYGDYVEGRQEDPFFATLLNLDDAKITWTRYSTPEYGSEVVLLDKDELVLGNGRGSMIRLSSTTGRQMHWPIENMKLEIQNHFQYEKTLFLIVKDEQGSYLKEWK